MALPGDTGEPFKEGGEAAAREPGTGTGLQAELSLASRLFVWRAEVSGMRQLLALAFQSRRRQTNNSSDSWERGGTTENSASALESRL